MAGAARPRFAGVLVRGTDEDQLAPGVRLQICWQVRSNYSGRSRSRDKLRGPKHWTVLMPDAALATTRVTRVPGRLELADMAIHHGQSTLRQPPRRVGREDVDSAPGPASPLPALPAWFWAGGGVASGAWVPA
jgi:hypothetical protein